MSENNKDDISYLVSIIVPIYNSERFLSRCLESTIHQTYKNFELLLIDDGSTDNSGKICDTCALNDHRVKVIHTKNSGVSAARNTGINNSKGEFIFFLDADDFISNEAINLLVENYNQTGADIIMGDFEKIKSDVVENRRDIVFLNSKLLTKQEVIEYARNYLKKPNKYLLFAFSWGRLFKSSIIKNNKIFFDADLQNFEDVAFNFDYLKYADKVFFLKEIIYSYQIYDGYASATMAIGNNLKKLFDFRRALVKISDFLIGSGSVPDIRREIGHADVYLTIIQLVRICGQINENNKKVIYKFINEKISSSDFRNNLKFYSPSKGDSRILPVLLKLKFISMIALVCKYKAKKRFQTPHK